MNRKFRTISEMYKELIALQKSIFELRYRATGRTTRLADNYIQEIFQKPNEWTEIFDHWHEKRAAKILTDRIRERLYAEHGIEAEVKSIDGGFAIRLKNYKKPAFSEEELQRLEIECLELKKEIAKLTKNDL